MSVFSSDQVRDSTIFSRSLGDDWSFCCWISVVGTISEVFGELDMAVPIYGF